MASDDPEFEVKAADIIALYLKPPVRAAVFCVDEKSDSGHGSFGNYNKLQHRSPGSIRTSVIESFQMLYRPQTDCTRTRITAG